ncbi:RNA polymerase sigma factor [Limibacterium fermenti]|jgi:RNA polymerase sigma factor (sigma-70 family)|uniref:RNA polymerase sigma factor n=1 Tax=Limibacterium fermenti TaxID=3229863 RepID=UPI000E849602|nr:RNA polymerase subunit sigma-70 [Porphyromonadaceae bacterium]HBX46765.1 RNA polymerase subunit sigma-70 [Porphyromonadaceae bacterium]
MTDIEFNWQQFLEYGDEKSFSVIYNCYVDNMYSYGISMGFQEEACKDAIQDVFYKIYFLRGKLQHIKNGPSYIFRSYKHRLLDLAQKEHSEDTSLSTNYQETPFLTEVSILDNLIDNEEAELLKKKVQILLDNLTSHQREAVYLRYMMELEYEDIANILNISQESVRKLIYRSLEKLREFASNDNMPTLLWIAFAFSFHL